MCSRSSLPSPHSNTMGLCGVSEYTLAIFYQNLASDWSHCMLTLYNIFQKYSANIVSKIVFGCYRYEWVVMFLRLTNSIKRDKNLNVSIPLLI